jgi:asparagine synthase (glutamine-hydrolysing)
MCGISGVVALDGALAPDFARDLRAMNGAIAHRGPDGDGFYDCSFASFGHRRLSIIDRAGGHQPMANEDDSCWIVFNGEIYNHKPLRRELEARGHRFRTVSDTEVILHAYEEFGPACLERLNGMFAFAICDTRAREVFIARDRLGKKPIFYAVFDGVLHFASELKALRQSHAWSGELDLSALEGYLSLGYFIEPQTVHRHVKKLESGHWMRIARGRVETRKYWDVTEFDTDTRPDDEILRDLEALLADAVSCRLESEVPLGAFLSGGIDSGLVVSWMTEAQGAGVVTTSVGFEERAHNELEAAGLTAAAFETQHHPTLLEPRLDDVFDTLVDAFDEPFADASAIPTYYVSKVARQHVTVALTGDGGDESFGGYDFRYDLHAQEAKYRGLVPGAPGRALVGWLGRHWPRSAKLPRPLRAGNVLENLGWPREAAYYADLCIVKPWDARLLLGAGDSRAPQASPVYDAVTAPYLRCASTSDLQRAQYADLKVYLPNDPLVKVDRTSMANSLEVRCPLLDYRVIEFAFRIPAERKSWPGRSKHFLRTLGTRRLPPTLDALPKRGFTAPVGEWIRGRYRDWFRDEVLSPQSAVSTLLDRAVLERWVEEDARGSRNRTSALWTAWCLERWARRHASRDARGTRAT